MTTNQGKITYTGRAFAQDAELAMSGDIVRALVELITNADDAYGQADGDVVVEITRNEGEPVAVSVRDNAKGLTLEELENCFSVLGGVTSGFAQGDDVRGLFGRGAKDTAAFGRTVFESIKDGHYGQFELTSEGTWTSRTSPATSEHRSLLQIPEGSNGLVATIFVEKHGIEIRRTPQIVERISNHIQLRRLTTTRLVSLQNIADEERRPSQVAAWEPPPSEHLGEHQLSLDGYDDVEATLNLYKLLSSGGGQVNVYSKQGIEVRGTKANYDNTFFGETSPETAWIRGTVDCPHLDHLIRDYDQTQGADSKNPTRILRRDRDGLDAEHPFTKALASAVLLIVVPILEGLKPAQDDSGGGQELRKDLADAAKDLSKLLEADLEDMDDDDPSRGGTTPTYATPLLIIPPTLKMPLDAKRSLTLLIHDEAFPNGMDLTMEKVSTTPNELLNIASVTRVRPHAIYEGISIANIRIEAQQLGTGTLTVVDQETGHSATSEISVQETSVNPIEPPETLEWKNEKMSVTVEKTRSVRLRAPIDLGPDGQLICRVFIEGEACRLEDDTITLKQIDNGWLEGSCKITGITAGQSATITARSEKNDAVGTIKVTVPGGIGGLGTEIVILDIARRDARGRVQVTDTGHLIEVYGQHAGLITLLGNKKANGSFQREQEPDTRIALCEAITSLIADWLLNKEATKYPQEFRDVDSMVAHRNKSTARYLRAMQASLLN